MTPPQIVHRECSSPAMPDCVERDGSCWLCGGSVERGTLVADWLPDTFTAHTRSARPGSPVVCEACVFVCSRLSPVPGRPPQEGKKLGGNFRNFSHLWDDRGYVNASKGEKPLIREFLAREHAGEWFAAIGDSGQKHVLPFAPMNGPGRAGRVAFEEQLVVVPLDQSLVGTMADMLTAGATKDEIASGDYGPRAWQLCGDSLVAFEAAHGSARHGGWFSLALWLAQRDEAAVQVRLAAEKEEKDARRAKRKAEAPHSGGDPGRAPGVPRKRGKRAHALGRNPGPDAHGDPHDDEPRGVGDEPLPVATPASPAQRELFGDPGAGKHGA